MYETYVPIKVERKPPTIAEIVRQKTDDGARIIDFFLDVMEGRVDGAMLCHRIDAAKQLVKYGSKKAADFIAEHGDETCDHCESRKRGPAKPRPRKDASPAAGPLNAGSPHAPGPYGYDFLTLLTEDFLTVLSAVDEDLMIKLLRAQTRDGGTVIDFLDNVMHGREDGFRVNHRISAAKELISHILRDEHAFAHAVLDNVAADPRVRLLPGSHTPSPVEPAPYSIRGADPRVRPLPGSHTPSPSTRKGGACPESPRRSEGDSLPLPQGKARDEDDLLPLPQGEGWGEGESPDSTTTTVAPAHTPREPVPGQAGIPAETQGNPDNIAVVPAKAGFLPQEPSPTHPRLNGIAAIAEEPQRRREGAARAAKLRKAQDIDPIEEGKDEKPSPAELTPAERRISENIEAHQHEPDPYGAPKDSTIPGRSPPR